MIRPLRQDLAIERLGLGLVAATMPVDRLRENLVDGFGNATSPGLRSLL